VCKCGWKIRGWHASEQQLIGFEAVVLVAFGFMAELVLGFFDD
jgi:hypothetical protein